MPKTPNPMEFSGHNIQPQDPGGSSISQQSLDLQSLSNLSLDSVIGAQGNLVPLLVYPLKFLGTPLLGVFVPYLEAMWSGCSRVVQRLRRLCHLGSMLREVMDATTACTGAAVRGGSLSSCLLLLREEALRRLDILDVAGCGISAVTISTGCFVACLEALLICRSKGQVGYIFGQIEKLVFCGGSELYYSLGQYQDDADEALAPACKVPRRQ
ncbi:unnamed protein product [Urochloa humidicola]